MVRRSLVFYLSFLGPLVLVIGWRRGGMWRASSMAFYQLVTPLLDTLVSVRSGDGDAAAAAAAAAASANDNRSFHKQEDAFWFRLPMLLWGIVQLSVQLWMVRYTRKLEWGFEMAFLCFNTGLVTSVGIAVGHELLHKLDRLDRGVAALLLSSVGFGHYRIAHHQHHRLVATFEDFSTARMDEVIYRFVPRSLVGGFVSSWSAETQRLALKRRRNALLENEILANALVTAIFALMALAIGDGKGLAAFMAQAVVAVSVHEMTSYIEHYGLVRRRDDATGKLESVGLQHSWLAPQVFTNYVTFNVQLHPDHHLHATKRYEQLQRTTSPQLPAGYPTMMTLALVPPLWRRVMHRQYERHFKAPRRPFAGAE